MRLKVGNIFIMMLLFVTCSTEGSSTEGNSKKETIRVMEYNPSSEYIAIFGDIQYYTNYANNYLYQYSCDWILKQKQAGMNINSVLHTGDVTQSNNSAQWDCFYNATQELAKEIPYISAIGDHDYTWGEDGYTIIDRNNTEFSKYLGFPLTKQKVVAWFEEGHMENVVVENNIHGLPIYFLVLEFGPRKEVVDWANNYVKSHSDIHFILINHEYLESGGRRTEGLKCVFRLKNTQSTYTTPNNLWKQLIKSNDNILCVLCGHVSSLYSYIVDKNDFGREVPQIQHNIQGVTYRYDNWLMLWEFPEGSDSVNVSIINTKSFEFYNMPTLFKFKYRK